MKKVAVIGHFGFGQEALDGQTVKTKILTEELCRRFGQSDILQLDTHGKWKMLLKSPFQVLKALRSCRNVIILPAHNGVRIYGRFLPACKKFFRGRKIHYVVIGGWLPEFLKKRAGLTKSLKRFDGIYVETNTMKIAMESQGFENVLVMPNCKRLSVLPKEELVYPQGLPLRLCTFSRVMQEKGIETAVRAVKNVNEQLDYTAFALDIYGQVGEESKEWFEKLQADFPDYVRYCGSVDADKSVEVLQDYFALLFPTHFYTEGIPGTIIDAYAAGIPVISAKWESFSDVKKKEKTGIGYKFDDEEQFADVLLSVAQDPKILLDMKANCLMKAKDYFPEAAIKVIAEKIGGGNSLYPLKLCTFSRVMREKGIEDAVKAVTTVNAELGYRAFSLDIFGQIDSRQTEWFEDLQKTFPDYIHYGGLVPFDKSVETLKSYYMLLFPTYYEGEGFAGTLIDAYSAGVPVIASDWRYNPEIVNENVGYVYNTGNQSEFVKLLKKAAVNVAAMLQKKRLCLLEAEKYKVDEAIKVLLNQIEGD